MLKACRNHPCLILMCLMAASANSLLAQEKSLKPGINDGYKKQGIDHATTRFENEKRVVVKKQQQILEACRLKPGMVVADIGAGTGLFTRPLAKCVSPEGKVYAVDVTKKFVEHIEKTCRDAGIANVVTVLCTSTSAKLPPQSVDLVFTCDVYHHFEYPYKMLDSIRQALRDNGVFVIIDRKKASNHVRAGQETVKGEVTSAGFTFLDEKDIGEDEYLMRFRQTQRSATKPTLLDTNSGM